MPSLYCQPVGLPVEMPVVDFHPLPRCWTVAQFRSYLTEADPRWCLLSSLSRPPRALLAAARQWQYLPVRI